MILDEGELSGIVLEGLYDVYEMDAECCGDKIRK